MNTLSSLIKRHPFTSFVTLTYLLSWWPSLLYLWDLSPIGVAAFGLFLAALIVLGVTEGKPGIKTLFGRMVHWRVGWPWYLVAFGLPLLMAGIASYLTVLLGAPAPSAAQLAEWPAIGVVFLMRMLIPGLGRHLGRTRLAGLCGASPGAGTLSSMGIAAALAHHRGLAYPPLFNRRR